MRVEARNGAREAAIARLEAELGSLAGHPVALERPREAAHGDYATNVALRVAPTEGRAPRDVAKDLAAKARGLAGIERVDVAGPGFLNLWLAPSWYAETLADIVGAGTAYGSANAAVRERVQVEFVSANPTGPITVASARNAAYGDSVARLLAFAGHDVDREYYVNDVGEQIDRFHASVEARARGEEPPEGGYHGAYVVELARAGGDPVALVLEEIARSLARFRVEIESWVRQSDVKPEDPATLAELALY